MIPQPLTRIAEAIGARTLGLGPDADPTIPAVGTDSRRLEDGALFVALRGEQVDGHDHAQGAVAAGAAAVLAERELPGLGVPTLLVDDTWAALARLGAWARTQADVQAVAITGSVGKTTVKDLTAAAVGAGRRVHAARGSFNNELGVPLTLLGLEADHEVLVAELGARHVGDIATLAPLVAPDIAIVTAVAGVHLEIFGSIEAIFRAKRELVESLGPGGLAILHAADPRVAAMAGAAPRSLGVALDADTGTDLAADVHAVDIRLDRRARPSGRAITPWGEVAVTVPLAGRHQLLNGLFALAVAGTLGVDLEAAAAAMAEAPVSPWRGAVEEVGGVVVLDDAYNANPTAVRAALETLVAIERDGRCVAVLGEMAEIGPDTDAEHAAIGARCAALGVDHLVVVGQRARPMVQGAGDGVARVDVVDDAAAAAALIGASLEPGDVVLVKASRVAGLEAVLPALRAARTDAANGPNA